MNRCVKLFDREGRARVSVTPKAYVAAGSLYRAEPCLDDTLPRAARIGKIPAWCHRVVLDDAGYVTTLWTRQEQEAT